MFAGTAGARAAFVHTNVDIDIAIVIVVCGAQRVGLGGHGSARLCYEFPRTIVFQKQQAPGGGNGEVLVPIVVEIYKERGQG
ncbi:MAG: hypothetical protein R3C68_07975 [Myxococcota bacterium]